MCHGIMNNPVFVSEVKIVKLKQQVRHSCVPLHFGYSILYVNSNCLNYLSSFRFNKTATNLQQLLIMHKQYIYAS